MKRKWFVAAALAVVLFCITIGGVYQYKRRDEALQQSIAAKILRFHILANSDSDEDQAVKLKVRDAVGLMMEEKLKDSSSLSESERIVDENLDAIVAVAKQTLEENGYHYGADARLARVDFPVKTYGDLTFPAGEYEALQVTLGEGKGHNWWCVLYPNMCFQGSVYEVVKSSSDGKLREVLSPEEFEEVFHSKSIRIRLKFLEYFR